MCDGVTMLLIRIGWYNLELGCICFSFPVAVKESDSKFERGKSQCVIGV